jgi:predicted dienelactone hydrolase
MQGLQGLAAAVTLMTALIAQASAQSYGAGLLNIRTTDPVEGGPMTGVIAYPTNVGGEPVLIGGNAINATLNVAPEPGPFPLVIISHGTGGWELGHHDSLTTLARAGFTAAAVRHPRDNYLDDSGFGTDLQSVGRSHHIVAFIDAVLAHPVLGPRIDRARIGMAGFSAGGYTSLLIIGARPNFALGDAYARAVPDDPLMHRARAVANPRRRPDLDVVADPRVRAAFIMAPALGFLFDPPALAGITVPIRLYRAGADEVLPADWNAERVRQALPRPPEYAVIEGAGHFIFLAPCSASLAQAAPEICRDPPGLDRAQIHQMLNADMVDFFRRTLAR